MLQAGSTVAKKLPKQLDYRVIGMARNLYALPALVIIMAVILCTDGVIIKPNLQMFSVLSYTGLLKYGLAMVLWYKAIRAMDLSRVTAIYLSYPVLSLLGSAALGLEKSPRTKFWAWCLRCWGPTG